MSPGKAYVSGAPAAKKNCLSSVAQTCNQLSSFLKDKGGRCLKDVHFGINSNFDDDSVKSPTTKTMDLLSNMENLGQNTSPTYGDDKLLPPPRAAVAAASESSSSEFKSSKQMTIFYNGQVIVVDDISEDRAKEVMLAAAAATDYDDNNSAATSSKGKAAGGGENLQGSSHHELGGGGGGGIDEVQVEGNKGLDLPIARRASLHKFLAKRRDRATLRPEPYQLHNTNTNNPSGPPHHKNNVHKFDLNL